MISAVETLQAILVYAIVFGPPAASLIWFVTSLILFCKTPKESEKRHKRKTMLIVSGIVAAFFLIIIVGLWILLMIAIANM